MGILNNLSSAKNMMNSAAIDSNLLFEIKEEDKKKLQYEILMMYKDVKKVCDKYHLKLFLTGGSALGAIRHKGFIPWDDDMDLCMTRSDYMKLCKVFEKELSDKYILNAPNYSTNAKARFPKILKKDSHFREILDVKDPKLQKLFLDNIPENKFRRYIKGCVCNVLEFISGQVFFYENRDKDLKEYFFTAGKSNYYSRVIIGFIFSFLRSSKWFDCIDKVIQYDTRNA